MRRFTKPLAIAGSIAALVAITSATTAVASTLIASKDIKDGGVHRVDLGQGVQTALTQVGAPGQDGVDGKDGIVDLNAGANYTHNWVGDEGASLNTIVSKCDDGQVALGGGFSTWGGSDVNESGLPYDLGGDNKNIQITVSAPYTGKQYDESQYHGGILPDRWVVKGYNLGDSDQIVRAWVTCADVN